MILGIEHIASKGCRLFIIMPVSPLCVIIEGGDWHFNFYLYYDITFICQVLPIVIATSC